MFVTINYGYLCFLFVIDICGLNRLWNERYSRRLLHHIQRGVYNKKRIPLFFTNQKLTNSQLEELNSIEEMETLISKGSLNTISPFLSNLFNGIYSPKSSLNINDFNPKNQQTLLKIGNELIPSFEKLINKPLYLTNTNDKCFILRYIGANSKFNWHYDNEHNSCFRAAFLFKKSGNIPDFLIRDINGDIVNIKYELGEGTFMKGKTTFHGVERSSDQNCKRYMILFQYTTDPWHNFKSLCCIFQYPLNQILGEISSNAFVYLFLKIHCYMFFSDYSCNMDIFTLIFIGALFLAIFKSNQNNIPEYIGTHVPISVYELSKYFILLLIHTFSAGESLLYLIYIVSTELLLPKRLVNYF